MAGLTTEKHRTKIRGEIAVETQRLAAPGVRPVWLSSWSETLPARYTSA
jgi:hypothetical protein